MKKKALISLFATVAILLVLAGSFARRSSDCDLLMNENIEALSKIELWPNSCFLGVVEATWSDPWAIEVMWCIGCKKVWATKAEYPSCC